MILNKEATLAISGLPINCKKKGMLEDKLPCWALKEPLAHQNHQQNWYIRILTKGTCWESGRQIVCPTNRLSAIKLETCNCCKTLSMFHDLLKASFFSMVTPDAVKTCKNINRSRAIRMTSNRIRPQDQASCAWHQMRRCDCRRQA